VLHSPATAAKVNVNSGVIWQALRKISTWSFMGETPHRPIAFTDFELVLSGHWRFF